MAHRDKTRKFISKSQRKEVLRRDKYVCGYCPVSEKKKPSCLVIDHIIPVRYGGCHGIENWVTACRSCNRKKWLYAPREKGAPGLLRHSGRLVAKATWLVKRKRFPRRIPKISYKR